MSLRHWTLPALGLTAAALLLAPTVGVGYSLSGDALALSQRDFRVYNSFTDPTANDNTQPDPSFPGATGATLAIWKGVVEWGSELHGTGAGDPTQPLGLGSGGANFDASYQGEVDAVGSTNSNVVYEIDAFGGGTIASTELRTSDGWRIKFYREPHVFHDGPSFIPTGEDDWDIQGVMAHEYGHALGLGHTASSGATMSTSSANHGVDFRSIEEDDVLGVRRIYGLRTPEKPRITSYVPLPGGVEISGEGFHPTDNEVWFTRAVPLADVEDGTPVKATGVPSHDGGTRLRLSVPAEAGPGDVLVRLPGNAHDDLSNAFPFDPDAFPCTTPEPIGSAKQTSIGTSPELYWIGLPSATSRSFELGTIGGVGQEAGLLFSGPAAVDLPFYGGRLYAGPPQRREETFQFFFGSVSLTVDVEPSMVGSTRVYQLWFHDPGDASGVGLSDGLRVTFCP